MKRCCACGLSKPPTEFWKHAQQSDGLHPRCKPCGRAARLVSAISPEQAEHRRKQAREWKLANPEATKRYARENYARNVDVRRANAKAYREANADKFREYFKRLRSERPDRVPKAKWCEYAKAYAKRHPERVTAHCRNRRVRMAGVENTLTASQWRERLAEFGGCCGYCLAPMTKPSLDHFRPICRDGGHVLDNVVPACSSCNSRKKDSLVFDWVRRGVGVCQSPTSA